MRILFSILFFTLVGCASIQLGDESIDRESQAYLDAFEFLGRNAKEEFERNRRNGKMKLYAIELHLEEKCTFPGLEQAEVDHFIGEESGNYEIVHNDVYPVFVTDKEIIPKYYWAVLNDFISTYNRLMFKELSEKRINLVETTETSFASH